MRKQQLFRIHADVDAQSSQASFVLPTSSGDLDGIANELADIE